jgi:transposase
MQGKHIYQPKLFSTFNLESLIPKNHQLRKIDEVLDFSFVRELTENLYCKNNGRPSIDPEIFLRMILVGYFYGISSDRGLCEEVGYNLAYRWFCRLNLEDTVPDHSSLTRIRDRFGEKTFEDIFRKVVQTCIDRGLVKGDSVMMDGSLFRANASLDSLTKKKDVTSEQDRPEDRNDGGTSSKASGSSQAAPKSGINKVKGEKISNKTHVSKTDPEATIAGKESQPKNLYYKAHETIDRGSRVIVDCHVTTGSVHETTVFQERTKALKTNFGFHIGEVIADRGYGSADNQLYLREKNIRPIIPLWSSQAGKGARQGTADGFRYDYKKDVYICPEGANLHPTRNSDVLNIYVASKPICASCPRYQSCVGDVERRNGRGKMIRRNIHQRLFEWVERRSQTKLFKKTSTERMWKMEGIWAEAKNCHGLERARYRGRGKVQIQAYLIASVQNLKRLVVLVLNEFGGLFFQINGIFVPT